MKIAQKKSLLILHERADWIIASTVSIRLRTIHNLPHRLAVADADSLIDEASLEDRVRHELKDCRYLLQIRSRESMKSWRLPWAARFSATLGIMTVTYCFDKLDREQDPLGQASLHSMDELDIFAGFINTHSQTPNNMLSPEGPIELLDRMLLGLRGVNLSS